LSSKIKEVSFKIQPNIRAVKKTGDGFQLDMKSSCSSCELLYQPEGFGPMYITLGRNLVTPFKEDDITS